MAGLSLMAGGNARVRASTGVGPDTMSARPATVTEAAFGPGAGAAPPSRAGVLLPNDAFGVTLWVGVAAVLGLAALRYSLPR